jgi:hypothetical protein
MSNKCYKCGKDMSSKQALAYHMTSRSCVSEIVIDECKVCCRKLEERCSDYLISTLQGQIVSVIKSNNSYKDVKHHFEGNCIYEYVHSNLRFSFSREHITLLTGEEGAMRKMYVNNFNSLLSASTKVCSTFMVKRNQNLHIFQNRLTEFDLRTVNDLMFAEDNRKFNLVRNCTP